MTSGNTPRWSLTTWETWRAKDIWDRGFLVIKFDTFGDSHFDYYALVRSKGDRMVASLHRDYVRKDDERIRKLKAIKPDQSSVRVNVPLRAMRFSDPYAFRWMVNSMWASSRCGEGICLDRAPDQGAVQEPRPPVPTPTITATPTPEPTESNP